MNRREFMFGLGGLLLGLGGGYSLQTLSHESNGQSKPAKGLSNSVIPDKKQDEQKHEAQKPLNEDKPTEPLNETEYLTITEEEIANQLRRWPQWLVTQIETDYESPQEKPLRLSRTVIKDPTFLQTELGLYIPRDVVINLPSIWVPGKESVRAGSLKQELLGAIHHEIGHDIIMRVTGLRDYHGPSRADLLAAVGGLEAELREKYLEEDRSYLVSRLEFPELTVHDNLIRVANYHLDLISSNITSITSFSSDIDPADKNRFEQLKGEYARISNTVNRAYNQVKEAITNFKESPRENKAVVEQLFKRNLDEIEFYQIISSAINDFERMGKVAAEIEHNRPSAKKRRKEGVFGDTSRYVVFPDQQFDAHMACAPLQLESIKPYTEEAKAEKIRKLEARFTPDEILANCIQGLFEGRTRTESREKVAAPDNLKSLFFDMRLGGLFIIRDVIDSGGKSEGFGEYIKRNDITIKGKIHYSQ